MSTYWPASRDGWGGAPERDEALPDVDPQAAPSAKFMAARERFLDAIEHLSKIESATARDPAAHAQAIRERSAAKQAFHDASVKY